MTPDQFAAQVHDPAGGALDGVLDDPGEPAKLLFESRRLS